MTDEWPYHLTPGDKILPIIAFEKRFIVDLEILPSDGVIFYTDGSLCEGRKVLGFFEDLIYKGVLCIWFTCYLVLFAFKQRYIQFHLF
jgi:hypothetical protein